MDKPVYTVKILISEQIAFAAVIYFEQVFGFLQVKQLNRVGMVSTNNL